MNLQFAICNFFQTVRQNLLYVSVLQQGLGRKIANCKLQIANSLVQTHPIEAISTKWLTVLGTVYAKTIHSLNRKKIIACIIAYLKLLSCLCNVKINTKRWYSSRRHPETIPKVAEGQKFTKQHSSFNN